MKCYVLEYLYGFVSKLDPIIDYVEEIRYDYNVFGDFMIIIKLDIITFKLVSDRSELIASLYPFHDKKNRVNYFEAYSIVFNEKMNQYKDVSDKECLKVMLSKIAESIAEIQEYIKNNIN